MRGFPIILSVLLFGPGMTCLAGESTSEPIQRVSVESLGLTPRGFGDPDGPHPPPGTVVVVGTILTDNGDGDDWADTNETIRMQITLYNRMGFDLTGVVATLRMDDPRIACVSNGFIAVGDLSNRESATSADAFVFTVADIQRTTVAENFAVLFAIDVSSDQFETIAVPSVDGSPILPVRVLDLDLDVAGGVGPTTFAEDFESGFGAFEAMPLDEDLNPPDFDLSNNTLGLQNADGYRCTYSDPDWERSSSYGTSTSQFQCYPNPTTWPDAFWFHLTEDRAFQGTMSVHWGSFLDPSRGFTSPLSQLEAIRTSEPINLGWGFVCRSERTIRCGSDTDCPAGDECARVNPVLSFKHQTSFMDHRTFTIPKFGSAERAVVQGQLADDVGNPIGEWVDLNPYLNTYDTETATRFTNCMFDPIDDGSTEDDFFNPSNPERVFGPSSTCFPRFTFVDQGDTGNEFAEDNLGDASDGPGLQGTTGIGTWIEPRISLGQFRGRRVRLRFLQTGLKINRHDPVDWEHFWFQFNPDDRDDGWFIDNVAVTDTLAQPATVAVDTKDSAAIKSDWDFDGVAATCDCNSADGTAWAIPGGVNGLLLSHSGGPGGTTSLSWTAPADIGGTEAAYDTIASPVASDFDSGSFPIEDTDSSDTSATDANPVDSGAVRFYLVRARNSCGVGPL